MSSLINENQQWVDDGGNPIVNGKIYIGDPGLDPVLNPKSIFSDRDLTVALANPVSIDSNGFAATKIFLSGRYSLQVDDASAVTLISELDNGEAEGTVTLTLDNVAGINAITADGVPTITSYDDNDQFLFEIVSENTADAVTLNIDGLGAKTIKRSFDLDVGIGRFKVGQKVQVVYNAGNDNFELVNDNRSVILGNKGADIASAATVDLSAATGNAPSITGHTGPITSLGTVLAGVEYDLTFPGSSAVTITSSSIANPTNILCSAAHGLTTGDTVLIEGHSGSVPVINGTHVVTVVDSTNITIPVNVTTGGTGGTVTGIPVIEHNDTSLQLAGASDRVLYPNDVMRVLSLGSGNWRELNYGPAIGNTPTGTVNSYIGTIAPNGWILLDGGTIGSATSGATTRAHQDAEALFALYWDSMADAQAPVSSGRGASAAADFAANKTITISDLQGASVFGTGGTAPATHGDNGGAETHTLALSETPAHDHGGPVVLSGSGSSGFSGTGGNNALNLASAGGGGAHNNMPPWVALSFIIKL